MSRAALLADVRPRMLRGERATVQQPAWLTDAIVTSMHGERGHIKNIAAEFEVSYELARRVADPHATYPLRAFWIPAIVRETGSFAVLDAIEAQVGRVAVVLPTAPNLAHADLIAHAALVMRETSEALSELGAALADHELSATERARIKSQIDDAHAALATLALGVSEAA